MSSISNRKSGPSLMCRTLSSDPVSRLSTQMTRWPRATRKSHRWEPRKPAPPVTREVGMGAETIAAPPGREGSASTRCVRALDLSEEAPEWAQVQVQVLRRQSELLAQLLHPSVQLHEGLPQPLDLLLGQGSAVDPPQGLPLHQLPKQLDDRQHELREPLLHGLRVRVHPPAQRVVEAWVVAREQVEVGRRVKDLVPHGWANE